MKLHEGTKNKLSYVTAKLHNMIYDFYIHDTINARFTPDIESCEKLECEINKLEELIFLPRAVIQPDEWELIKKYCTIADEFRLKIH